MIHQSQIYYWTIAMSNLGTRIPMPILMITKETKGNGSDIYNIHIESPIEAAIKRGFTVCIVDEILSPYQFKYGNSRGWYITDGIVRANDISEVNDAIFEIMKLEKEQQNA